MPKSFHALPARHLKSQCTYMHPPELPEVTHIHDNALSVMLDFKYHTPPTISAHKSLDEAKIEMQIYHLPVLLVADHEKKIIGIVTSEDILGEKPVKTSHERRIPRSEIEIHMIMMAFKNTLAIDIDDLVHMKVGHVIQTFRETQQHILLVYKTESATGLQKLRGLFSASIISKQLDKSLLELLSQTQPITELQQELIQ